jgi:hypothetical protein
MDWKWKIMNKRQIAEQAINQNNAEDFWESLP